jgi:membrane fusion protein, macrolide-specific efflux system
MKKLSLFTIIIAMLISGCDKSGKMHADRKDIIDAVFASGHVQYSDEYWVTANTEGFIMEAHVKESDKVGLNQSLFQLSNDVQSFQAKNALANYQNALAKASPNSPQIVQLKNQIEQSKASLELDKKNYERNSELVKTNAISQLDFEKAKLQYNNAKITIKNLEKSLIDLENNLKLSLENAKNQLDIQQQYYGDYHIKSMIAGYVLEVNKNKGELVKKGEMIARIGGGNLVTKLFVAEEDINSVQLGQKVQLALNTEKDKTYQAKVSKIYPSFDNDEQSFVIEVKFNNETPQLYSGTQVQANVIVNEQKNALVIPKKYLVKGNKVLTSNNEEIQVKVGIKNAEWVQIIEGIDENTALVLPKK